MPTLSEDIERLRIGPSDERLEFFAFNLSADDRGEVLISSESQWVGFEDENCRVEIRQPRLVNRLMAKLWNDIGQPCLFVLNEEDFGVFILTGGNALIEKSVAKKLVPDWLEPHPAHYDAPVGFIEPSLLSSAALKRATSPKVRMNILKRDGRRCRICGRTPDDNVDLVLNIHHIRPWGTGGITAPENLITLCHTCHAGLDPHFDPSLYAYIDAPNAKSKLKKYEEGLSNYQRFVKAAVPLASEEMNL